MAVSYQMCIDTFYRNKRWVMNKPNKEEQIAKMLKDLDFKLIYFTQKNREAQLISKMTDEYEQCAPLDIKLPVMSEVLSISNQEIKSETPNEFSINGISFETLDLLPATSPTPSSGSNDSGIFSNTPSEIQSENSDSDISDCEEIQDSISKSPTTYSNKTGIGIENNDTQYFQNVVPKSITTNEGSSENIQITPSVTHDHNLKESDYIFGLKKQISTLQELLAVEKRNALIWEGKYKQFYKSSQDSIPAIIQVVAESLQQHNKSLESRTDYTYSNEKEWETKFREIEHLLSERELSEARNTPPTLLNRIKFIEKYNDELISKQHHRAIISHMTSLQQNKFSRTQKYINHLKREHAEEMHVNQMHQRKLLHEYQGLENEFFSKEQSLQQLQYEFGMMEIRNNEICAQNDELCRTVNSLRLQIQKEEERQACLSAGASHIINNKTATAEIENKNLTEMIKLKESKKHTENDLVNLKQESHMTDQNYHVKKDDRIKNPPSVRPKWSNKPKTRDEFLTAYPNVENNNVYGGLYDDPYIFYNNPKGMI